MEPFRRRLRRALSSLRGGTDTAETVVYKSRYGSRSEALHHLCSDSWTSRDPSVRTPKNSQNSFGGRDSRGAESRGMDRTTRPRFGRRGLLDEARDSADADDSRESCESLIVCVPRPTSPSKWAFRAYLDNQLREKTTNLDSRIPTTNSLPDG